MIFKLVIDAAMTVVLILLMSFERIGRAAHEWLGLGMFILFIAHHVLNRKWLRNLPRGRYSALRIFRTVIAAMVLLCMLGAMVSAVILSREIFGFLHLRGGRSFARQLHMLAAYWGFTFMSLHLGLHWGMILEMIRKAAGVRSRSGARTWGLRAAALGFSGFGLYAFFKNKIPDYLLLRSHFVFFDWEQPLVLLFLEYIAMMVLWACVCYYLLTGFRKIRRS